MGWFLTYFSQCKAIFEAFKNLENAWKTFSRFVENGLELTDELSLQLSQIGILKIGQKYNRLGAITRTGYFSHFFVLAKVVMASLHS